LDKWAEVDDNNARDVLKHDEALADDLDIIPGRSSNRSAVLVVGGLALATLALLAFNQGDPSSDGFVFTDNRAPTSTVPNPGIPTTARANSLVSATEPGTPDGSTDHSTEAAIGDAPLTGPIDSTEPGGDDKLASRRPSTANVTPGVGFTNSNGTYFSTYGAPPEVLRWMDSPNIIFNQRLPASTPAQANSATIARNIDEIIRGERLYGYGSGIEDDANAPYMILVDSDSENFTEVVFRPQNCGNDSWWSWTDNDFNPYINGAYSDINKHGIPLPSSFAMNPDDSDFHLMVYDWRRDILIELWKAQPSNITGRSGIEACWGGVTKNYAESSSGIFPFPVGVDAAGLAAPGLTITLEDVRRGEINHAIGVSSEIAINNYDSKSFSYPANRNDGLCTSNDSRVANAVGGTDNCLYEGQYLRLSPDYDIDSIQHPVARMVAKAGRDYGFVVHDVAGCFCFQAESGWAVTANGLGSRNPWFDAYAGTPEWEILWQIDWTQLEVLPPNWNRPDNYTIRCAVPPGRSTDQFPMKGDARCAAPGDPYRSG